MSSKYLSHTKETSRLPTLSCPLARTNSPSVPPLFFSYTNKQTKPPNLATLSTTVVLCESYTHNRNKRIEIKKEPSPVSLAGAAREQIVGPSMCVCGCGCGCGCVTVRGACMRVSGGEEVNFLERG